MVIDLAWLSAKPLDNQGELVNPLAPFLAVLIVESLFQTIRDQAIGMFNLAVGSRVSY
jgi:hypothetical protein